MKILVVVVSLFALFFSAAGYVRVKYPDTFYAVQKSIIDTGEVTRTTKNNEDIIFSNLTKPTDVGVIPVDEDGNSALTPATYEDYTPEKVSRAASAPVVLFFHASWCPSCISTDRILKKKITTLPPGVSILKIDYDTATDLKVRYDVTYQHTFIQVNASGEEIARWSGGALDGINANLIE